MRHRALIAGAGSLLLVVGLTGPAFAGGNVDPVTASIQDQTSSPLNVATATPKHGCPQSSCTGSTSTAPAPVDSSSGELWFWDGPSSFRFPAPFATTGGAGTGVVTTTWSYPQMAAAATCPGPLTGSAGSMPVLGVQTSRNIAASFSWVEYGSNDTYTWFDMTNPLLPVIKQATFGSSDYNFVWGCKSYTPPALRTATCAKFGQYQLMGPFDRGGADMVPASQGGSNTRTVLGVETTTGPVKTGSSTLGDTIAFRPAETASAATWSTYVNKLSTTAASKDDAYNLCLATEVDLTMRTSSSEEIDSYGRYYSDAKIWRDQVRYYVFNSYGTSIPVLSHLWPSIYGTADWHPSGAGYLPVYVASTAPMARADTRSYYAVHCVKNTTANAVTRDTVPAGGGWAGGNWNAVEGSDDQFYAYQCSGGNPTPTRDDDLLSCDRFGTPTYAPYQFQTAPYTYHQGVIGTYQELVTDWCGYTVGPNGEINVWCAQHEETRYIYGPVRDATPAGFSDTGTNWTRKLNPPNGYVDDGTQYVSYSYSDVIEDHKYASPIASGLPNRFAADGIYDANMTGDRYRFQWKLPRVNLTATGQDVTKIAGADVRWRARFKLEDSSSPIVIRDPQTGGAPSGGKNDSGQPYHLFLDTSPATSNDNPGPFLSWSPLSGAWSGPTPSVPVDRWSPAQPGSWLDQARTLWVRFFASSTAGKGWKLTPWWEVTVTVPITSTSPTMSSMTSDGDWILGTSTSKTETRRQTYECPGQSLRVVVDGVTSGTLGEYQAVGGH